ncbi:MAG: hypothetical protein QXI58_07080, partial [Candidatus Micrarchaeia archaeon]
MKHKYLFSTFKSCYFLFLIVCFQVRAQDIKIDYNTPEKIYRYAEYLYNEEDYLRAIGEYQRYLFAFDSFPLNRDSVFYKIGLCYRLSGNFFKAIDNFNKILNNKTRSSNILSRVYYQIAFTYSLMNEFKESTRFLKLNLPFINETNIKLKAKQLIVLNHLLEKEWDFAIDLLSNFNPIEKTDPLTLLLLNYVNEGKHLPRKNKLLAGLFSTIIPGSGKMYCGRAWDGFFSLITITTMGWQAYDGFRREGAGSTKGWIFGSLSAVFY